MKNTIKHLILLIVVSIALSFVLASCDKDNNLGTENVQTIAVTHVTLNNATRTVGVGGTQSLTATVWPQNASNRSITWLSSDTNVATVSGGVITGVSVGTATVTVITQDGSKTAICAVTVVPPIAVTGVTLNHTTFNLDNRSTLTLIATVLPSTASDRNVTWTSSDTNIATVNNGIITPKRDAIGSTVITVTTVDGDFSATSTITIGPRTVDALGCNNNTPAWGSSLGDVTRGNETRISANDITQTWSDAVTAFGCQKTTFAGGSSGNFNADCRSNPNHPGDLFSWCAVQRFADELCPAPWRVPTTQDFINLDRALVGTGNNNQNNSVLRNRYLNDWGASFGGRCESNGSLYGQGWVAYYWSQWEFDANNGKGLIFYSTDIINPQGLDRKNFGFTLRCVR
jgi:uncharacterized protein (TIGR02145 family)